MKQCKWLSAFLVIAMMACGCGDSLPNLAGVNKEEWISDKNGCLKKRAAMKNDVQEQKDKLLALDEMQIVALLGKPDQNELYKRNQKFYYYWLGPAPACSATPDSTSSKLVIRFNAMGLAKEVSIE